MIDRKKPFSLVTMGSGHFKAPSHLRHRHFGKIESDDLQTLVYRSADAFVMPSLEEAFGQTALEAVACGTVVAGFAVGGVGDIVKNGLNGLLVPKGDSAALSQAITELLDDVSMRQAWQEKAREWVSENFSYQRNASAYMQIYSEMAECFKA